MHAVTLFGRILDSQAPGTFVLDVEPQLGDAPRFKLAGQISLARRQCLEVSESRSARVPDIVSVPEHIAQLKSELAGNVARATGSNVANTKPKADSGQPGKQRKKKR